ncbi:MAG: iron-sulfur cluster insertion protein ErpA [Gammaproteobacteria bacterium]|nr:iron-sulfur cluster insertion protein ErpA [Gammaproteobacteria bacterium]
MNVDFTDSAARKIQSLIEEEANPNLLLRIYVTGGGCSGLQYGFTLDETSHPNDTLIQKTVDDDASKVVKVAVDAISLQYLTGAKVDYTEDLSGAQFIIHNPNAKTKCGCGSSFSVEEDD